MLSSTKSRLSADKACTSGKTLLQTLFFFLLITQICFAQPVSPSASQSGWFWQNPLPTNNALNSVDFTDENTGWCVGEYGTIIKTIDGGENWITQASGISEHLRSVRFVNASIGLAVGDNGMILKTIDAGASWVRKTSWTSRDLNSVCFIDENHAWACGDSGLILITNNGGQNWVKHYYLPGEEDIKSVYFVDQNNGWAVGDKIYKTSDGGSQWSIQLNISGNSICFVSADIGWVVGDLGKILKTTNGGINWISQTSGTIRDLVSVSFIDNTKGLILGLGFNYALFDQLFVLKTADGGNLWEFINVEDYYGKAAEVFLLNEEVGWLTAGSRGNGWYHPSILKTNDGGNNWISLTKGDRRNLISVHFVVENTGWIAGNIDWGYGVGSPHIVIRKTTDAGTNWVTQIDDGSMDVNDIFFIDNNTGWAVGGAFVSSKAIIKTTDGGESWTTQLESYEFEFKDVYFIDSNTGWAVAERMYYMEDIIFKTTDGGNNWNQLTVNPFRLYSIYFTSANIGWAVGESGIVIKTTNGGTDWLTQTSGIDDILWSIDFIDSNIGWAVGENGSIINTTNGGENWNIQESLWSENLNAVEFIDQNNGWAVGGKSPKQGWSDGGNGVILTTTDGGLNWTTQLNTTSTLNSVYFLDQNTGWVVGWDGTILHTTNGGASFFEEETIDEIPREFLLSQNYPNPFNPSTKIKYSVPQFSQIQIKVFDILGNEIETLVNEEKPVGTYELTWVAEGLTSGVYFYQLRAGSFVETKKMLLLK